MWPHVVFLGNGPPNWRFMAVTRIKGKCQVRFRYVGNLSEKGNLKEKSRLLEFLMIYGHWNQSRVLWRSPTLTSSIRVKSIFCTAPQITAKMPPNAPETQEIITTQVK